MEENGARLAFHKTTSRCYSEGVRKRTNLYPPGMNHARERFYLAVTALVEGRGDVRSRLKAAYEDHLSGLISKELPKDLRGDFQWIVDMLNRPQPGWKGGADWKAPLERMQNKTGVKIARRIFQVYQELDERVNAEG